MSISSTTVRNKTKIKIVLLGDQNVGKTSLIERYIHDRFDDSQNPTIGIDFVVTNSFRNGKNYRLQLWDTAGQERFKSLIPSYLKDSNCAIILYDVTNLQSAQNCSKWLEIYHLHKKEDAFAMIVGNKIDLKDEENTLPQQQQVKEKCQREHLEYQEISTKSGENVNQLFNSVIDIVEKQYKNAKLPQSLEKIDSPLKSVSRVNEPEVRLEKKSTFKTEAKPVKKCC